MQSDFLYSVQDCLIYGGYIVRIVYARCVRQIVAQYFVRLDDNALRAIAVSAVISYLISLTVDNPSLVGPLTPLVNLVLVGIQQFIKSPEE